VPIGDGYAACHLVRPDGSRPDVRQSSSAPGPRTSAPTPEVTP
jgi:hypothetical protein